MPSTDVSAFGEVRGVRFPPLIYGTAWKEEETERLVQLALQHGFRGIDTANQRRHYDEAAVGSAIAGFFRENAIRREELFLQTKFTYVEGQDHRLPYDPRAPIGTQVRQSLLSSLSHLGTSYVDCLLLHGPSSQGELGSPDWEAWRTMEELAGEGKCLLIGASNMTTPQIEELYAGARIAPAFVQNRCFARLGWDRAARACCRRLGIGYQGFSLLTANADVLRSRQVHRIAARLNRSVAQVVFRFALQVGMVPLTGTSDPDHMSEDLDILGLVLTDEDVRTIEQLTA